MSLFSLEWFKSQRAKEVDALKLEKMKIENDLLKKQLGEREKPFRSIKLINDVVTIVMEDGSIISRCGITLEQFYALSQSYTIEQIIDILKEEETDIKEDEVTKTVRLTKSVNSIVSSSDEFVVDGNSIYLKGINRSLPALLIRRFGEIIEAHPDSYKINEEFVSLKRFFMWCCLNPRAEVADDLYDFLDRNSFRITKQGFFAALRNVVSLQPKGNELVDFISNSYHKIKAVWKKKPSDYNVMDTDRGYELKKVNSTDDGNDISLGNLQELYDDLPNMKENRFTDAYTKTFDIRIGNVVKMDPKDCSWSRRDCAEAGLHFTSNEINYVGCGDTSVLVLINPMKVVGIGASKGRCYEYLPIMSVPRDEATEILHDLDFDVLELDEKYAIDELENLEEKVKEGFVAETKKHEFNISKISTSEIRNIATSLGKMKDEIKSRVIEVK